MRRSKRWQWVLGAAIISLSVIGCSDSDRKEIANSLDDAKSKTKNAADSLTTAASKAAESVTSAVNALKDEHAGDIKLYEDKLTKLKADAAKLKDQRLDGYIAAAEKSLSNIETKLASLKPDQQTIDAVKSDLSTLWIDMKAAYQMAVDRMKELTK